MKQTFTQCHLLCHDGIKTRDPSSKHNQQHIKLVRSRLTLFLVTLRCYCDTDYSQNQVSTSKTAQNAKRMWGRADLVPPLHKRILSLVELISYTPHANLKPNRSI